MDRQDGRTSAERIDVGQAMRTRTAWIGLLVVLVMLLVTACGPATPAAPGPDVKPSPARLIVDEAEQQAGVGTYCWTDPSGAGEGVSVCVDMIGVITPVEPLAVPGRFLARFRFPLDAAPASVMLNIAQVGAEDELDSERLEDRDWRAWQPTGGERFEPEARAETAVELSLEPGLYVLSIFARWDDLGDVNYGWLVEVGGDGVGDPLAGTAWILTSLRGEAPLAARHITLAFDDGIASGFAGCSSYGSAAAEDAYVATVDGDLAIPTLAMTAMACLAPEGVMAQEEAYVAALMEAATYEVTGDTLVLKEGAGEPVLTFARRPASAGDPSTLPNTAWRLVSLDGAPPVAGPGITLAFHADGRLASGHAACRSYVATYTAGPDALRFAYEGMMGAPCDSATLAAQEAAYTDALTWIDGYRIEGDRLTLNSMRGETLVYERVPVTAQPAFEGTTWSLLAFVEPSASAENPIPNEPLAGTEVTAAFEEGEMGGSSGCNRYSGSYTRTDGNVAIAELVHTERACLNPAGVMAQEQRYLLWLAETEGVALHGDQLWLTLEDSRALVFRPQVATRPAARSLRRTDTGPAHARRHQRLPADKFAINTRTGEMAIDIAQKA